MTLRAATVDFPITVKTRVLEHIILQVSLIRFLCIDYLVGKKAVQVLKFVLISFRLPGITFVPIEISSPLFTVS